MTDKQLQAPLSEPTDPRIAELEAIQEASRAVWAEEREVLQVVIADYEQRLEQVTAERDKAARDRDGHLRAWRALDGILQEIAGIVGDERISCEGDVRREVKATVQAKEAAEATITSLRETAKLAMDALAHHDDWCGYNRKAEGHPSWNKAWAALDAVLASLPSSAVSRTAERQD